MVAWRISFASLESESDTDGNPQESEIDAAGITSCLSDMLRLPLDHIDDSILDPDEHRWLRIGNLRSSIEDLERPVLVLLVTFAIIMTFATVRILRALSVERLADCRRTLQQLMTCATVVAILVVLTTRLLNITAATLWDRDGAPDTLAADAQTVADMVTMHFAIVGSTALLGLFLWPVVRLQVLGRMSRSITVPTAPDGSATEPPMTSLWRTLVLPLATVLSPILTGGFANLLTSLGTAISG